MTSLGRKKARQAALRLILGSAVGFAVLGSVVVLSGVFGSATVAISSGLAALWGLFSVFTLNFFRDPTPVVPQDPEVVVAPAHGTVDVVEEHSEAEFMGGACWRISIFLNVFDVHIQRSPVSGRLQHLKHREGKFLSATQSDCGMHNENVLMGFEKDGPRPEKVGVRLIAGLIARRIIVWTRQGATLARGEHISLIQFGSRCDVYLPQGTKIESKLGDKVKGGESVIARFTPLSAPRDNEQRIEARPH